jgi:hypothetical protein
MQIPSWAFTSAGKSLFGYKSEPDLVIVQMPEPLDISLDTLPTTLEKPLDESLDISVEPVQLLMYESTMYDEIIELVNHIIQNSVVQILIELYT